MKNHGKKIILILFILAISFEFFYFLVIAPKKEQEIAFNLTNILEFRSGYSPLDEEGNPLWIFNNEEDTNWIKDEKC